MHRVIELEGAYFLGGIRSLVVDWKDDDFIVVGEVSGTSEFRGAANAAAATKAVRETIISALRIINSMLSFGY